MNKRREVEVKFPLKNGREMVEKLNKIASFKYEARQVDKYFNPPHRSFIEANIHEWLRLRVSGVEGSITYKNWAPKGFSCDEFETKVSSVEDLELLLKAVDFKELVVVDKLRKVWLLDNDFEVSVDEVKDLGHYIEVEYKGDLEDVDEIVKLLMAKLKETGAEVGDLDKRGYPWELLIKKGIIKP